LQGDFGTAQIVFALSELGAVAAVQPGPGDDDFSAGIDVGIGNQ